MIFVDTGAWYASLVPTDPDHTKAVQWLAGNDSPLLTTDYVIDETLTLLRARTVAFAFDHHFHQFGTVQVVP